MTQRVLHVICTSRNGRLTFTSNTSAPKFNYTHGSFCQGHSRLREVESLQDAVPASLTACTLPASSHILPCPMEFPSTGTSRRPRRTHGLKVQPCEDQDFRPVASAGTVPESARGRGRRYHARRELKGCNPIFVTFVEKRRHLPTGRDVLVGSNTR